MHISPFSLLDPIAREAAQFVGALSHLVPGALAVVLFTVGVRLLLHPFARAAARGEKVRSRLAPHAAALRKKHARDPERMRRELSVLYREEGASPLAGCLPMLLQIPVFSVMYRVFTGVADPSGQALLAHTLLGVPLGAHLAAGVSTAPVFGAILLGLLVLGYLNYRRTRRLSPQSPHLPALLPFGTAVFAALLPLAGALYLLTTTAWTFGERALLM
ncbi:YidC/Oxa1 family membrane protein insertase [Streptacidiphilus jiangxiensis]|uniref:Membrane protein insertase YidC n=1 Tax=Streptacidiphilus jiangxiensis TaxID=235985 RepID=A0A1H7ZH39_STRJI|nr:membrane protein insertase YidC [Streptacidiphilus jiangxiensis]SEM57583.1 YidC/Oxa1 family membrane protein insertase [Streptacidiphilus jiangxiensis]